MRNTKTSSVSKPRKVLACLSALAVAAVVIGAPLSAITPAQADVVPLERGSVMNQQLMAKATEETEFELPAVEVVAIKKSAPTAEAGAGSAGFTPPAAPATSPGTAQDIARGYVGNDAEFSCLYALWKKESNWNSSAMNSSSGAYGIPQALPGSKMASAGADWQTNAETQIRWGLGYISARYGSPCAAWLHSQAVGWY
ncbi:lytic transglycosylase domain-containing protein [Canibacter zhuwentaonis]|uniref:aggregation-promoting factor C-terminal-like domain-containing protein n=1 Tax=Canibacter zhuwentaonis TaxID=2837491 RepID=UPI003510707E